MLRKILPLAAMFVLVAGSASAQVAPQYSGANGSIINGQVMLCPAADGIHATACPAGTSANPTITQPQPTTAAVASAQQTCTTSAVQLPNQAYTNGFVATALTTNTGTVYIGGSGVTTSTGYPLKPGQSIAYNAANSNQAYLICDGNSDKITITGN
jgi:hypothetical protein